MKRAAERLLAVSRMDAPELRWRARARARASLDRARASLSIPRWQRGDLAARLDPAGVPPAVLAALKNTRWMDAHVALSAFIQDQSDRFLITPRIRGELVRRIASDFPDARREAAARADRIVDGVYDLLGYRGLRFSTPSAAIDWHWDPVHGRRMPDAFWSTVAYLDPAHGDHKIVWELNRHQHWIALARAYWLTDDVRYRDRFVFELTDWIEWNPPLRGCNWASMLELAFRALAWTWSLHSFTSGDTDGSPWTVDLLLALDRQLDHVEHNLSRYFSPNTHLLGEALALYVTGRALPFFRTSARRASVGREVLLAEISRQIAPDGGHRERSSHYHRYTLDFYLIALAIARITGDSAGERFREVVGRLSDATLVLSDSCGRLARFGDDDGGMTLPIGTNAAEEVGGSLAIANVLLDRRADAVPEEAVWFLAHPAIAPRAGTHPASIARGGAPHTSELTSTALTDMGYFVSRSPGGVHAVMHAGPHGYMNGGHAHADALSMTVSLQGVPLLVDPGTGCYTADCQVRDRFRSTKLHNALTVDGRSQSIPHGPFHWKHRAGTTLLAWRTGAGFDYLEAAHDGYAPLEHRRHVMSIHDDLLVIMDLVVGDGTHTLSAHWQVDPRWDAAFDASRAALSYEGRLVEFVALAGHLEHFVGDQEQELGWHAPVYGRIEPGLTLRLTDTASLPSWTVGVFSLRAGNRIAALERLDLVDGTAHGDAPGAGTSGGARSRNACGVRIVREHSLDYALVANPGLTGRPDQSNFGEISTDARMCFCRIAQGRLTQVSLVDGVQLTVGGSRPDAAKRSVEMVS